MVQYHVHVFHVEESTASLGRLFQWLIVHIISWILLQALLVDGGATIPLPLFWDTPWSPHLLKDYSLPMTSAISLSCLGWIPSGTTDLQGSSSCNVSHTSSSFTDGRSVPTSTWIFVPKGKGPTVLVKAGATKVSRMRTSVFSALLVINSPLLFNSRPTFAFWFWLLFTYPKNPFV